MEGTKAIGEGHTLEERHLFRSAVRTMAAASAVCACMAFLRIVYLDKITFYWLIVPNLLLAWIPLIASRLAVRTLADRRRPGLATIAWGAVWLAFYPNASYIATDLKHLSWASTERTLYYDLSLNMLTATLGFLLGAVSLYMLHIEVRRRMGAKWGAAFACAVHLLGAVGVYLGRVLRWNSWDLVVRPWRIVADAARIAVDPGALLFVAAFAVFTGTLYAVLYKFAVAGKLDANGRLHHPDEGAKPV
ncbi:DUF1361 domain-containing protein [Paenibacillus sp. GYB003]|uniref:DUF1361 domain-containing protein n=1 Tax=Paenibacillus sp. GYB003 TaxID=2994392 RepID=UPI002F963002